MPAPRASPAAGVSAWTFAWLPWRLAYGAMGFVLAGDLGPVPFTGFRWFSGRTSPWIIHCGEFFVAEDAYATSEWPPYHRTLIGSRASDPEILPRHAP